MRTRHHFLPIEEAQVGMVLCESAQIVERGYLSMTLPAGHTLTAENLSQLIARHAEFIDVDLPDERSDEQVAVDTALSARRVMEIFSGADLSDPAMATFFDQVLAYRSA
jgi:hypothetical protein